MLPLPLKIVLWIIALSSVAFGLASLVTLDWLIGLIHLEPTSIRGSSELRAIYGGLVAAIGVMGIIAVRFGCDWFNALAILFAGLAVGRIASLLLDGMSGYTLIALGFEAGAALIYRLAFLKISS